MSSHVQIACPERAPFLAEQRLAGGQAQERGATPARRGLERQGGFEAEGKIEGTGTGPVRRPVCTWGWRGTRRSTAQCLNMRQRPNSVEEIACLLRSVALVLDIAET